MRAFPRKLDGWLRLLDSGSPGAFEQAEPFPFLQPLVLFYLGASQEERDAIRSSAAIDVLYAMLPFAHQAAEEAVRQADPARIGEGLAALALGCSVNDPRDNCVALSLLAHSAEKTGADYNQLFEAALAYSGKGFRWQIRDFLTRDAEDRRIYEMGYQEGEDSTGFKYVQHHVFSGENGDEENG